SHARHLKCIIGLMKPLLVMLLLTVSVQAQSLADAARQERARQAPLQPTIVIREIGTLPAPLAAETAADSTAETKGGQTKAADVSKPKAPPAPDPVDVWNGRMDQLRAKIRDLQDQEMALQLQRNDLT